MVNVFGRENISIIRYSHLHLLKFAFFKPATYCTTIDYIAHANPNPQYNLRNVIDINIFGIVTILELLAIANTDPQL